MVNLLKNLRQFQNYIFKIQWEIHFLSFLNTNRNAPQKNLEQLLYSTLLEKCFKKTVF